MSCPARPAALSLLLALYITWIAMVVGRPTTDAAHASAAGSPEECKQQGGACRRGERGTSAFSLRVAVGYGNQYRASAWVPIRVTVKNRGTAPLTGVVTVPDDGALSQYASAAYASLYQSPVAVGPGDSKRVILYVPGADVNGAVSVQLRAGNRVVATATDAPSVFDDSAVTIGTLTNDPFAIAWLRAARLRHATISLIPLSVRSLDTVPESLANFDAIVLTNVDTALLSRAQTRALDQYVQEGGTLVLVGGPDWQETLEGLPPALVPGTLTGSRALPRLSDLQVLGGSMPPRQATIVSLLTHARGSVVAAQDGVPLVVRQSVGQGRILYSAFDPAVAPLTTWSRAGSLFAELVKQATPQVGVRLSISNGTILGSPALRFGPSTMGSELANIPSAVKWPLYSLLLLIVLVIFIMGPVNFLLLSLWRKRELAWAALPALSLLLLSSSLVAADRLQGNLALVNTAGMVELGGATSRHPAIIYAGLFAPVSGTYRMQWQGPGLAQGAPDYIFRTTSSSNALPVGVRLGEGGSTAVTFPSMAMWSTRSVAIRTAVTIPGTVRGTLHVARDGSISGEVRNGTHLTLHGCVLLAGNAFQRLPDLQPGATHAIRLLPHVDLYAEDLPLIWDNVYRAPSSGSQFGSWDGDPWEEPEPAKEVSLIDRLRNVGERLPEAQDVMALGEVLFAGWIDHPLVRFRVDGAVPQRRDTSLVVAPLTVHLSPGPLRLRPGTLGASLVDIVPAAPMDGCCPSPLASQPLDFGPGGSATFEFDIPDTRRVRFSLLDVAVNAGGADWSEIGQAYDWRDQRWVHMAVPPSGARLRHPERFISPNGALLLRLHATTQSGDIVINDPHLDLQLSGRGRVQ